MSAEKVNNETFVDSRSIGPFVINAMIGEYLEQLAKTGLYGASSSDVAKTLLYETVRKMVQVDGTIPAIPYADRHVPPKKNGAEK